MPSAQQPYNLQRAQWIDVNTRMSSTVLPELIPDLDSVRYCSFFNLFKCPIGGRGRIFNARIGSNLYWRLQEPLDTQSTTDVADDIFTAIRLWEPRITVDELNSSVQVDYTLPGYAVTLVATSNITGQTAQINFKIPLNR